jgi:hypothetical protein
MKVAFICAPYRGSLFTRLRNIWRARKVAQFYWKQGYAVICPHMNSALFKEEDGHFLEGYRELVKRSDVIFVAGGLTKGMQEEVIHGIRNGVPWEISVSYGILGRSDG